VTAQRAGGLAGALAGVRVLDLSRVLALPFAAQTLADLGADVVKVEAPGTGDETRAWGPPFLAGEPSAPGARSAYFLSANRGKRSVTLDLAQPEGRRLALALAARSDVVFSNFLPASAARLGLAPADLLAARPDLVVVTVSGFGATGADATRPGYDFVAQAMGGVMATTGPVAGPPCKVGVAIVDIVAGLYAANAALAGLVRRARAPAPHQGTVVDVALLDAAAALMSNVAQAHLTSGADSRRRGNAHATIVPYDLFPTADEPLVVAVGNDGQFARLAAVLGEPALAREPRYATNVARVANRDALTAHLTRLFAARSQAHWLEALSAASVPAGGVWSLAQLFASDLAARRALKITARTRDGREIALVRSPIVEASSAVRAPPALGEDTAEVLAELADVTPAELARLRAKGVV
jgi:crotonobetainyl-CoA:carnitine CoA-transferase CaiB-like acyl-CoA transferase